MPKNSNNISVLLLLWLLSTFALAMHAQSEEPFILGDEKIIEGQFYICRGNAELFWKTYHVFADEIVYDTREKIVRASGRVAMSDKDNVISGDSFRINLREMTGEMQNVVGVAPPAVTFRTEKLQQADKDTFRFKSLQFSSCGQLTPDWSIRSQQGKIKKNEYIQMSHVVLKINLFGGIPIFYFPYMRYPIQKEGRSTGFLFPNFGLSKQKGFFLRNAFFWAPAKNFDITAKIDWFEQVGVGIGGDVRYIFHGGTRGNLSYYNIMHRADSVFSQNDSQTDYQLSAFHEQRLPFLQSRLTVSVNRESNPMVRQLFSESFAIAQNAKFFSRISFESQLLKNLSFSAGASSNETYFTYEKKSVTVESLPSLSLRLSQQKLPFLPGRISLNLSAEKISRKGTSIYPDDSLYDSDVGTSRLIINPQYTVPVFDKSWLNLSLDLSSQIQLYSNRKDPVSGDIVDDPLSLSAHSVSMSLQGIKLEKIYQNAKSQLQHLFFPEITFSYSSSFDDILKKQIVRIDNRDYSPFSYVSFALKNKLRKKSTGQKDRYPKELLDWSIGISYFMDPENANKGRKLEGEYVRWSPIQNTLRFSPTKQISLNLSLQYTIYVRLMTSTMISLSLANEERSIDSSLYYSYHQDPYFPNNPYAKRSSLGSSIKLNPEGWPLALNGELAYIMNKNENNLTAGLRCDINFQCWTVEIGAHRVLIRDRDNKIIPDLRFQFGVRLGHMSTVTDLLSSRVQ